ncbi:uncharacterized protein LOC119374775 isoform X3 [Rhipicephalus sanguineus]|uniref:uncharacterized protein LOC119374775 isoform X3 n=1 Tax=Rhipicephalus sanguineus TaxID=34632 RepID=UPI0020C514FE|nr:uncharacterized protein LOC119374775 isoform X3 [Rhipicephalus sanguineus]XP_049266750.1 uncharacterized protein LOC119374775 isoform X3 [Rhipicephalus sanguineus]XP_049266751.1 uncharacterized protein LOC119374775 isoform X3 [Rhipicephalus sanguineus]XP_049266752.1 uncharacterized protein LOC119374775 isoform X3 [Rhipicephalus sanguineus]XP_049266753.1 uncharacterized protein LOC119374775 isoform X3 [Rhipicephalus sanguineus]
MGLFPTVIQPCSMEPSLNDHLYSKTAFMKEDQTDCPDHFNLSIRLTNWCWLPSTTPSRVQVMTMRNFQFVVMAMLLACRITSAEDSETQADGGETQNKPETPEKKQTVDIAGFYSSHSLIWILGLTTSHHPCMLDAVDETNTSYTSFTRYSKGTGSFHRKHLIGKFMQRSQENNYNAMEVSPAGHSNRRRVRTTSWRGTETMLYESSDQMCALFTASYTERPSDLSATKQKDINNRRQAATIEYDFRVKEEIAGTSAETTCLEELKAYFRTLGKQTAAVEQGSATNCKNLCKGDSLCNAALTERQSDSGSVTQ